MRTAHPSEKHKVLFSPKKTQGGGSVVEHLGRSFFSRYTPDVARDLLGCLLVRRIGAKRLSGRIVEVEAYRGNDDPASHSYLGMTKRSSLMFGKAGHIYVFFSYGFHWCLNLTTEKEGQPGAVLVRALEPVEGVREMMKLRGGLSDVIRLTNGPGKLTQALCIDGSFNGEDVVASKRVYLLAGQERPRIKASGRIGVSKGREHQWRFFIEGNPFVSKEKRITTNGKESAAVGVVG